jgi:hypothetical protein
MDPNKKIYISPFVPVPPKNQDKPILKYDFSKINPHNKTFDEYRKQVNALPIGRSKFT